MEIAAALPWWINVLLAMASYLLFHHFAVMNVGHPQGMKDFGNAVGTNLIKALATTFQYLVPLILGLGAVVSAIKQWERRTLFKTQTSLQTIRELNWKKFELLIGQALREKGYKVIETVDGPDGGVDLVMEKEGRKTLVQCKHWKKSKVGVKEVRELNGVVAAKGAYGGILVTSGTFTSEALEFAKTTHIELIDGSALNRLIPHIEPDQEILTPASAIPDCPRCGSKMVLRILKRGPNPGSRFWGCTNYPKCKGTLDIKEFNEECAK